MAQRKFDPRDIEPFTIVFDDEKITVDPGLLTFGDRREMRTAIRAFAGDDPEDAEELWTPALVWMALRKNGHDDVSLEYVVENLTLGSLVEGMRDRLDDREGDDPEG